MNFSQNQPKKCMSYLHQHVRKEPFDHCCKAIERLQEGEMEIPRERELKEKKTLTQVTQVKENKRASAKLPYY